MDCLISTFHIKTRLFKSLVLVKCLLFGLDNYQGDGAIIGHPILESLRAR